MDDIKDNVRLTLHQYDRTITNELSYADATAEDIIEIFYGALVSLGFSPSMVLKSMKEFSDTKNR